MRISKALITLICFCTYLVSLGQWQPVAINSTATYNGVYAYDADRISLFRTGGILRSTDGGDTWVSRPTVDGNGNAFLNSSSQAIHEVQPDVIVVASSAYTTDFQFRILRSTDGGASWSIVHNAPGLGQVSSFLGMAWGDATTGVAVGTGGRIVRTLNGGVSWTQVPNSGENLVDVEFADGNTAVAVGEYTILRTVDGGASWSTISAPSVNSWALSFANASVGFIINSLGTRLWRTDDAGLTWVQVDAALPVIYGTRDIWFTSPLDGYIVAAEEILHTNDGGLHWERYRTEEDMRQLHFRSMQDGLCVGENGTLIRTSPIGNYSPIALFQVPSGGHVCQGLPTTLTSDSDPDLSATWWVDGVPAGTGNILTHTFNTPNSTSTITLVVDNGTYTDTIQRIVNVSNISSIGLEVSVVNDTMCGGQGTQVHVLNSQIGTSYRLFRGTTLIGDPQSGNDLQLEFNTWGVPSTEVYHVLATRVVTGCGVLTDTSFFNITILDPDVGLTVTTNGPTVCLGTPLEVNILDSHTDVSYQLWLENAALAPAVQGTGADVLLTVPAMQESGTVTVRGTHSSGCSSTLTQSIALVVEAPLMAWGATSISPQVGVPVDLMNGGDALGGTYAWSFGADALPATSTAMEPTGVVFSTAGPRWIQLVSTTPLGCADTLVQLIHVIAEPDEQACGLALFGYGAALTGSSMAIADDGSMVGWNGIDFSHDMVAMSNAGDTLLLAFEVDPNWEAHGALVKYDRHGVLQWFVHVQSDSPWSTGGEVVLDAAGNSYLGYFHGEYLDSIRITDASGRRTTFDPPHGNSDRPLVVYSFDPQGRLRWHTSFLDKYLNMEVNLVLSADGGLYVQGYDRIVRLDASTGASQWTAEQLAGQCDISPTPDGHLRVMERQDLVVRTYDATGVLVASTPPIIPEQINGTPTIAGIFCTADALGNSYELNYLQGRAIIGTDTLENPLIGSPDAVTHFLIKRNVEGDITWVRGLHLQSSTFGGITVAAGRVFVLAFFNYYAPDTVLIQGMDPLPFATHRSLLFSYDEDGAAPHAIVLAPYAPYSPATLAYSMRALGSSPDGARLAAWIHIGEGLILVTDTLQRFPFDPPLGQVAIWNGETACLLPGLPGPDAIAQAYFQAPSSNCTGAPISFIDATLNDPVSWQWQFPGGTPASSTDQNPEVTYAVPGTWPVTLVASNAIGISVPYMEYFVVDVCTAVTERGESQLRLMPNPALDQMRVHGLGATPVQTRCMDLQGRVVWSGILTEDAVIDVSNFPSGLYFLTLELEEGRHQLPLVIAR